MTYAAVEERTELRRQLGELLGVIAAHEAEKAHGLTANMDHADDELYAAADRIRAKRESTEEGT